MCESHGKEGRSFKDEEKLLSLFYSGEILRKRTGRPQMKSVKSVEVFT